MADYTATAHVFPSANDVRGSLAAGWGKTMYEQNLGPYLIGAILGSTNYIVSGGLLPSTSGTLSITVPACIALIDGRYISTDATIVTVSGSVTSYVFLKVLEDANLNASSVKFEVNTTGTAPSNSVLIGSVVSGVATITSTTDLRHIGPSLSLDIPKACATGSTRSHEGQFVSATGNLSGIHFYSDFSLSNGHTLTIPAGSGRLIIIASGTITINGTITGAGGGLLAAGSGGVTNGVSGGSGTDQPGGAGGGNAGAGFSGGGGGAVLVHGIVLQSGGSGSTGAGGAGTQLSGSSYSSASPVSLYGGASGGSGSGDTADPGGSGGRGGASIVLIAPSVMLAATATLNTSGSAGTNAPSASRAGGGGGGAGNVIIVTRNFSDSGATFTQTGGAGGAGNGANAANGGAGAAGVKQIMIY